MREGAIQIKKAVI